MIEAAPRSPVAPHRSTAREVKERLDAERTGRAHLVHRDQDDRQVITWLDGERLTIGRREACGLCLWWDGGVSRLHAELELVGQDWTVIDDGLSRNGSFVNGKRVNARQRLNDGDLLTFGATMLAFRAPGSAFEKTDSRTGLPIVSSVSPADRCILVALCRPLHDGAGMVPSTNQEIAEELHLSVPAVKKRLRALFERFDLDALAQNQKRARLADEALRAGVVTPSDF